METALAKGSMDNVRRRDPQALNNVRSLAQLEQMAPSFDWDTYLQAIGAPTPKRYLVATPEFLTAMEQLIQVASLPEWKTYLRWWTLHGQATLLLQRLRRRELGLLRPHHRGQQEAAPAVAAVRVGRRP